MCKCTPAIRTPYCGKGECVWPGSKPEGARSSVPQDMEEFIASESYYDPEHPKSSEHDYILASDLRAWMTGHVRVPVDLLEACRSVMSTEGFDEEVDRIDALIT